MRYLIYRHGSNAANQSMVLKSPVGIFQADSAAEAIEIAAKERTVYNNQYLSAVEETDPELDIGDWNIATSCHTSQQNSYHES